MTKKSDSTLSPKSFSGYHHIIPKRPISPYHHPVGRKGTFEINVAKKDFYKSRVSNAIDSTRVNSLKTVTFVYNDKIDTNI